MDYFLITEFLPVQVFPNFPVTSIDISSLRSDRRGDSVRPLHLKSVCSMYGPDHIIVGGAFGKAMRDQLASSNKYVKSIFILKYCCYFCVCMYRPYTFTYVDDEEAANCVYANGKLLRRPSLEFPNANFTAKIDIDGNVVPDMKRVDETNQIELENSELRKVDGALTCCSVLF